MINYLIEKYFTLLKGIAYGSASSMSAMDLYEFDKPEQLKNLKLNSIITISYKYIDPILLI